MLMVAIIVKLVAEIGFLALIGRGMLRLWLHKLHPAQAHNNVFLQMLDWLCLPWLRLARLVTPKFVLTQHLVWVAALLLAVVWLLATASKVILCVQAGLEICR
jgi:hypothetical protein